MNCDIIHTINVFTVIIYCEKYNISADVCSEFVTGFIVNYIIYKKGVWKCLNKVFLKVLK